MWLSYCINSFLTPRSVPTRLPLGLIHFIFFILMYWHKCYAAIILIVQANLFIAFSLWEESMIFFLFLDDVSLKTKSSTRSLSSLQTTDDWSLWSVQQRLLKWRSPLIYKRVYNLQYEICILHWFSIFGVNVCGYFTQHVRYLSLLQNPYGLWLKANWLFSLSRGWGRAALCQSHWFTSLIYRAAAI